MDKVHLLVVLIMLEFPPCWPKSMHREREKGEGRGGGGGGGGRRGKRERERETDRQTDRQTDMLADRERERGEEKIQFFLIFEGSRYAMAWHAFLHLALALLQGLHYYKDTPPRWPSGKASASKAEDPGFESRLRRDFFGVESYQ